MTLLDNTAPANTKSSNAGLEENAFCGLFRDNKSIVDASGLSLPAETLAKECYSSMFYGCTSLKFAPELPAETLTPDCYKTMFQDCANLSSVTMKATDVTAKNCLITWLKNAGTDVTKRTLTIDSSLDPYSTVDPVKTIKDNSGGWDITNGTETAYPYLTYGYGIPIDTLIWAPVNCGYDATDYKYGKLYQWGRKDGCGYNDGGSFTEPKLQETSATDTPIAAKDENAGTFYKITDAPYDWLNKPDSTRWNSNTEWPGKETSPAKTEYDPCPEGWRVPTASELEYLLGKRKSGGLQNHDGMKGKWFDGTESVPESGVFLPAAGLRNGQDGNAGSRSSSGLYFSSSVDGNDAKGLYFYFTYAYVSTASRASGYSVRCVHE